MRKAISTIAVVGTVAAVALMAVYTQNMPAPTNLFAQEHMREREFQEYLAKFSKSYSSVPEHKFRREIFSRTLDIIEEHNSQNGDYKLGLNKYSDWTEQEKKVLFGYRAEDRGERNEVDLGEGINASPIDWREKGGVTPIKD